MVPTKYLFINNTALTLFATAKFNNILIVALAPEAFTTLLCSFATGAVITLSEL